MNATFMQRHPALKDILNIFIFIVAVFLGTFIVNTYLFKTFNVVGPSMENTFYTNDRVIVNRLAVSLAHVQNKEYIPRRGEIIVFRNPQYTPGTKDEYIVKRVIAFAGEKVKVINGVLFVYNKQYPDGFTPDSEFYSEPGSPTSKMSDEDGVTIPEGRIFVAGDHRQGKYSLDSRNGLGTIPYYDIVGPVAFRIFPFTSLRSFTHEGTDKWPRLSE